MYYNLLQNWQKPFTVEMYRNFNFIDAPVATGSARRPAPLRTKFTNRLDSGTSGRVRNVPLPRRER